MNITTVVAFFSCACAVFAAREDLVYHYSIKPSRQSITEGQGKEDDHNLEPKILPMEKLGYGFGSQEYKTLENQAHSVPTPGFVSKGSDLQELKAIGLESNGFQIKDYTSKGFKEREKGKGLATGSQANISNGFNLNWHYETPPRGYQVKSFETQEDSSKESQTKGFGLQEFEAQAFGITANENAGLGKQDADIRPYYRPKNSPKKVIWTKVHSKKIPKQPKLSWNPVKEDISNSNSEDKNDMINDPPIPWEAPPYRQALENYDAALSSIQKHFKREAFTYSDDKHFRYVVIAVVVDGLSKIVSERGWDDYNKKYKSLVKLLAKKAVVKPMESIDMIRCVFRQANDNIRKIRSIIRNQWTEFVCKVQPNACNTIIFAQLKTCSNSKRTETEATLLQKLGDAAATFLTSYAAVFETISEQNAYQYLMTGKEVLRELVKNNALVRDMLFPNGGPSEKECGLQYQ